VEEQVKEEVTKPRTEPVSNPDDFGIVPFEINTPNVGENAEAFVDASMASDRPAKTQTSVNVGPYGPMTKSSTEFNSSKPRVTISEYSEDAAGYFT
jgi:hypothetical protein